MRVLILLLLAFSVGLSSTACSKKKTSSAPVTNNTDNDGNNYYNNDDDDDSSGSTIYDGYVNVYDKATYKDFLYTSFGYQYDNKFSYSYSCRLDLINWILGGSLADCGSGDSEFSELVNYPALIELAFLPKQKRNGVYVYPVDGLWVVDPQYGGYEIPFQGYMEELDDGRFLLKTDAIALLTTTTGSKVNLNNFDVYYIWYENGYEYSKKFGNVTIK